MIHFDFPKPTINNQKPYYNEVWTKKKLKHKLDKMFFSILDFELNEELYIYIYIYIKIDESSKMNM